MNRRDFLQHCLAAALLLSNPAMLTGCAGVRRGDLPADAPIEPAAPHLAAHGRSILRYASLAPSGHNSQPWRVKIEHSDQWLIEADAARRLPCVDPENRELLLAMGAFIENLCLAAGALGWAGSVRLVAQSAYDREVARVTLRPDTRTGYPLDHLRSRRTVRHGQLSKALAAQDVRALEEAAGGRLVYFAAGSGHAACIREAAVESYRMQAGRDDAQAEWVQWLRLSDREARRCRDGLTTEGMEIKGVKGWFVRHFVRPDDFLKASYRRQGIDWIARLAGQGGGWLVITSNGESVADLIDTGRRFQRMALLARERGIGIHPMTQVLEETSGRALITRQHGRPRFPQFVLRVGYVDRYPDPVSLRRPVERFVYAQTEL